MNPVADRNLEELARRRGFPSAAAMIAFERHRQNATNPSTQRPMSPDAALAWHPRRLLDYVYRKFNEATQ